MPATILDIDGTDLFPYLRVAPGEGFDPSDPDYLEPQFGDTVSGVGNPLLAVSDGNREMVIPVHIRSPAATLTNEVLNPDVEGSTNGWDFLNSGTSSLITFSRQSSWSSKGRTSCRFSGSVGATGSTNFVNASSPSSTAVTAAPGETWWAIADANILTNTSQVVMTVNWFTAAGAFISTASTTYPAGTLGERTLVASGVAPATTGHCSLTIQISNVIGTVDMYFDNACLVKSVGKPIQFSGNDIIADWTGAVNNSSSICHAGKDGLHLTLQKLNRVLESAKYVTWRDEGLTYITQYDVQFARFEPEYNYRRGQKLLTSGVIRVFCKPFGSTGSLRGGIGSVVGTGVTAQVPLGTVILGDQSADIEVMLRTGSQINAPHMPAYMQGISIVPSGYAYDVPAASLGLFVTSGTYGQPSLGAASGGAGSQAVYYGPTTSNSPPDTFWRVAQVNLSPATMYLGRNRVLGVVNMGAYPGVDFRAVQVDTDKQLGPPGTATVHYNAGWGLVDLGSFKASSERQATVSLRIEGNFIADDPSGAGQQSGSASSVSRQMGINRVLILPEDSTALSVSTKRTIVGFDDMSNFWGGIHTASHDIDGSVDRLGNEYSSPMNATVGMFVFTSGWGMAGSASTALPTYVRSDGEVLCPTYSDWSMEAYGNMIGAPSTGVVLAKLIGRQNVAIIGPVVRLSNDHLTIGRSGMGIDTQAIVNVASKSLASYSGDFGLKTTLVGGEIFAEVWRNNVLTATLSASSSLFEGAGWPGFGFCATGNGGAVSQGITGLRFGTLASTAQATRDELFFSTLKNNLEISNASVYREAGVTRIRGAIPRATTANYYNVVGIQVPIAGGVSADRLDVEVYVRENFTYAR